MQRVERDGKHLRLCGDRFVLKGVTYGSFLPRTDGARYPDRPRIESDMAAIAALGLNTVRTYDLPPPDLVTAAADNGLRLLIGLDYDDWRYWSKPGAKTGRQVLAAGTAAVDRLAAAEIDPALVLGVSVGNEVPGDLVRVHGRNQVEDVLSSIVERVHQVDAQLLTTYTNYPTTEYLSVDGQDIASFNVFLEDGESFDRYLRHLLVASSSLPLVITELGLASEVHGEQAQADLLAGHLDSVERVGCAGATVFAWTDEWGVGGQPVSGWGFGITGEEREAKPATAAVEHWASASLKDLRTDWPKVSVVVCAYNEEATIGECLSSLEACDYPDLEVLVCDDGSTDRTLELAMRFPFTVLELDHGGLSRARNAGIDSASGDIVAFLDADAMCHPQWPWFLALAFDDEPVMAAGGPNLPVPTAGLVERAVALSPGSPTEVLVADDRAEHIAGCNMAFRREAIRGIKGFDPVYTSAGDDVDVCWKLLDNGHPIGFSPMAQVIHHRRGTVRGYLKQQRGYGRAEQLLSGAHPQRFNQLGQARWSGFIYGGVGLLPKMLRPVVYHGRQGRAPFQPISVDRAATATAWATALLPVMVALGVLGLFGSIINLWSLVFSAAATVLVGSFAVAMAVSVTPDRNEPHPLRLRALVGLLHVAQPMVRTWGRLRARPHHVEQPCEPWAGDRDRWLAGLERHLRAARLPVRPLPATSRWDLEVSCGLLSSVRMVTGVAWGWTPHLRRSIRPTIAAVLLPAIAILAWVIGPVAGAVATIGLGTLALFAARQIQSVLSIVAASTAGSEPGHGLASSGSET